MIGVVVVSRGEVVGESFAGKEGSQSAIVTALGEAKAASEAVTVYTNFEPSEDVSSLIEARPSRLVIGTAAGDQSSRSEFVRSLSQRGVVVDFGVCQEECLELNERFFKFSRTGLPFVTVKFAQSLDGRIATSTGDSQWISSTAALRLAHQLRRDHDSVLVGIGTVLSDDPRLTVRLVNGRDPLRIIIDSRLRIPLDARVLERKSNARALVATTEAADQNAIRELEKSGIEVMVLPTSADSRVNLSDLLRVLGERGIASVLVEGGGEIITSLLSDRLVDRLVIAVAPKLIGRGIEAVGNLDVMNLSEAITLSSMKTRRLGPDIIFDARLA
jgi:diaminohydroxyphosphoribosylaminopyrimidine deaminase/5-amino-6-(5-phosphoribosylamino)uracil reductase